MGTSFSISNGRVHPPAIVVEAIRDFAGCRLTPVFQAYMARAQYPLEGRSHAIYAQLGVTFIQCPDLGKDTADKKIISDMWKFYASQRRYSQNSRIRIILITGDRDFADAIGQLRNMGVEIGVLTGHVSTTAPVYDDYTLGIRVLPLLGIVEARARDTDLTAYQTSKKLSLFELEARQRVDGMGFEVGFNSR
jgi:NYN domain